MNLWSWAAASIATSMTRHWAVVDQSVCQLEPWQIFTDSTMGRLIDDRMTSLIAWHVCLTCIGMLPQTLYSLFSRSWVLLCLHQEHVLYQWCTILFVKTCCGVCARAFVPAWDMHLVELLWPCSESAISYFADMTGTDARIQCSRPRSWSQWTQ